MRRMRGLIPSGLLGLSGGMSGVNAGPTTAHLREVLEAQRAGMRAAGKTPDAPAKAAPADKQDPEPQDDR